MLTLTLMLTSTQVAVMGCGTDEAQAAVVSVYWNEGDST